MPFTTTTTYMILIDPQIAQKILNFIGSGIRERSEILLHIGEQNARKTPFDTWAKTHLVKKGRNVWGCPGSNESHRANSRLNTSDKQTIASLAAMDALLSEERVLTEEIAQLAAQRSGIKPLPLNLKTVIEPYFKEAWATQISELLLERPVQHEIVEIDKPLERWRTEELVAEVLKRMPQYIPLVEGFYSSLGENTTELPPLQRLLRTTKGEKPIIHILVTGLFSRQSSEFVQRTKITHAIDNNRLRITFIDQDRYRWSLPSTVSKVFMFDKRSHKVWNALCKAYGADNIVEFHGLSSLEQMVLPML